MSYFTEAELREYWKNGKGSLPEFPVGSRFSNSALDFLKSQNINVSFTPSPDNLTSLHDYSSGSKQDWNKPGEFPVVLSGPIPKCTECGQPIHSKPEYLTQLDAEHFARKTHPRIIFRGKIDNLHAKFMLSVSIARRFQLIDLSVQLETLSAYCRELLSAEYNWRKVAPLSILGLDENQLREISHHPEKYLGINHIVPSPDDHEILHWLNYLRTETRELEIDSFKISEQSQEIEIGLNKALNRLSSAVYVLELYFRSGKLNWHISG